MNAGPNQQFTSVYVEINGQKLSQMLTNLKDDDIEFYEAIGEQSDGSSTNTLDEITIHFNEFLDGYKTESFNVNDVAQAPTIIANAAMLFRFQVEVLEILSGNATLSEDNKKETIKKLFGEGSEYKKLYDEYYKENGLVERAQSHFKNLNVKHLFDRIIPQSFQAKNQVKLDDLTNTFKEVNDMKQVIGLDGNHPHETKLMMKSLDGDNFAASLMGLIMSDPKQLGTLFALMGDRTKNGEIDIIEDNHSHIGSHTMKGVANSALRFLFIGAILGAFIAVGYFAAPAIAAFVGIASISAGVTSAVVSVTSSIIGFTAIAYIDKKAVEEVRYTYNYQQASVNTDFNKIGVASDNVIKYTLAPIYKGNMKDKEEAMNGEFEKRFNNIASNIFKNRQVINTEFGKQLRQDIDTVTDIAIKNGLNQFGISYTKGKQLAK